jgi:hypothetical protein
MIFYYLPQETASEVTIEISDAKDRSIAKFSSEKFLPPAPDFPYGIMGGYAGDRKVAKKRGLNRFVWDLRYPPVDFPKGTIVWGFLGGPKVAPGEYKVTLTAGATKQTRSFRVLKDPRVSASQQDLEEQQSDMLRIRDILNRLYAGVRTLRSARQQANDAARRLEDAGRDASGLRKAADELQKKLNAVEDELMQPRNEADQDTENFPTKLDNQLAYVYMHLNETDNRLTSGDRERVQDLEKEIESQLSKLKMILDSDISAFNQQSSAAGLGPAILLP